VPAAFIILPVLGILALAYGVYSRFIARRIMELDDARVTPAHSMADGRNFHATPRWMLFGHHFAAIAGPGPLIGPVLAAQFGFAPGLLWIVAGVCLAGAVHDSITLWASTRRCGASLGQIARMEIGPVAGFTVAIAVLFVIVIALAGVGVPFVNALSESPWGVFTISMTVPLALLMSLYMYRLRPGHVVEATVLGVIGLLAAVVIGRFVATSSFAATLTLSKHQLVIALALYGFMASILPVWLLLTPRDYLSAFLKIGVIGALVIGVIIVNPPLHMPAFTPYVSGGGPIVPGPLYPFAFITIACGAVSGFHSLISSGTTPKMIDKESDVRVIGYGAMLMEGLVGVVSLIAACSLQPGDYFAINTPPAVYATLGQHTVALPTIEAEVGEQIAGRSDGGPVSLAVGMAQVFSKLPGMTGLASYWYHFAIMFEALFILTVIDAGTRVGRYLVGEFLGRLDPRLANPNWLPAAALSTALVVASWAYFIWTGSISTIWPMFGVANQLMASIALAVGTTVIINAGKARYAWVTLVPMSFLSITTLTAGWMDVTRQFWPMAVGPDASLHVQGLLQSVLTVVMMVCVVVILVTAARKWLSTGVVRPSLVTAD
jgi:carbon starvation protein